MIKLYPVVHCEHGTSFIIKYCKTLFKPIVKELCSLHKPGLYFHMTWERPEFALEFTVNVYGV